MADNQQILVGKIVAPQGIRGEVRIQTFTEKPSDFQNLAVFGKGIEPRALHFVRAVPNTNVIIAKIDGIADRNMAETLRGTELFINRDSLPKPGDNEYYQADLIGMARHWAVSAVSRTLVPATLWNWIMAKWLRFVALQ